MTSHFQGKMPIVGALPWAPTGEKNMAEAKTSGKNRQSLFFFEPTACILVDKYGTQSVAGRFHPSWFRVPSRVPAPFPEPMRRKVDLLQCLALLRVLWPLPRPGRAAPSATWR